MSEVLTKLKPEAIWKHFEKLCSIPRPSKHEQKVAAYIKEFAQSLSLDTTIDNAGNVIVRKPATKGMESRRTVVLQTHLDMVPQKNEDVSHNFATDPIRPKIDGNKVCAQGTTLGADNGIGIAATLAVFESKDLQHGPIEALFTVDEEAGMTGANHLKAGLLKGDILFNLDSEDEGELCIGCAGGMDVVVQLPYTEELTPKETLAFRVRVTGLKGGHSGVDIPLGRGNSNKILTRILWENRKDMDLRVASFEGGDLRNAIPREATAVVTVPKSQSDAFSRKVDSIAAQIKREIQAVDPGLSVKVETTEAPQKVMDKSSTNRFLNALYACPHGVFSMIREMPNVAETSTNLAIVKMSKGAVMITNMLRSSVESRKTDVANIIQSVFALAGGESQLSGGYPGWTPDFSSSVLKALKDVYQKKFGKEAHVVATHGGLECGIIRSVYPQMEAVSFGPTIKYPHSPDEYVDIPSVQKFWDFLTEVLRQIPAK